MNLTYRKLAMMEKEFIAREEEARIAGLYASQIDNAFKERITKLLDRVRNK